MKLDMKKHTHTLYTIISQAYHSRCSSWKLSSKARIAWGTFQPASSKVKNENMYDLKCNADLHTRSGRYSALNLVCPRYNRESEGGRTFSVSATRLWNSLPIDLKKGTCVTSFRKAIYSHFLFLSFMLIRHLQPSFRLTHPSCILIVIIVYRYSL